MGIEQSRESMRTKSRRSSANLRPIVIKDLDPKIEAKTNRLQIPSTFEDACKVQGIEATSDGSASNEESEHGKKVTKLFI